MASLEDKIQVTAGCLCKTHEFKTLIPKSNLPLKATACHCTSCRHSTGALYSIDAEWPEPRDNVDTTKLSRYEFSANIHILFCGTCSTPLFFEFTKTRELGVFTGALGNHDVDLVRIEDHIFVEDTVDGGASMWLRNVNTGAEAKRFHQRNTTEAYPSDWPENSSLTGYSKKSEVDSLPFWCHCKGINLTVHRANYDNVPKEELPWYVDPENHKPLAGFDPCDSCRLNAGIDIFHWTFGKMKDISFTQGKEDRRFETTQDLKKAVDAKDPITGTLAYYASSEGVQRYFCKTCSATAFYCAEDRSEMLDIAIGLLEAPDGTRAEGFLSWAFGGRMVWQEDADGGWREGFLKRVSDEAEKWRIERDYPKCWRRVEKEKAAAQQK